MTRRRPLPTRVFTEIEGESRTHQSFADDADINTILGKWRNHDITPVINPGTPVYEDFSNATDYLAALNAVQHANDLFDSMPARVRKRCDNDPAKLIEFLENPANEQEAIDLGLLNPVASQPKALVTSAPKKTEPTPKGEHAVGTEIPGVPGAKNLTPEQVAQLQAMIDKGV